MAWPTADIRNQFPILGRTVHGHPLVYLDNAATTQKPLSVIQTVSDYYSGHNANVHRGVHTLGDESTRIYHDSRDTIARFFGAQSEELILTRNATEGLNLAALSWGRQWVKQGDVVVASLMEHHSNFVPWQRLAQESGATFIALPLSEDGRLDWQEALRIIDKAGEKLKVVALTHIANTTGAVVPIEKIVDHVQEQSWRPHVLLVLDAAQSAARRKIDFHQMGVDALAFSGHKMYGPMGVGGLLVKKNRLDEFPPLLVGGGMIGRVSVEETTYAEDVQDRFAAGTPDVAGAAGLAAACDFLDHLGMEAVQQHDEELVAYAYQQLTAIPEVELIGPRPEDNRQGSAAFLYKGIHAHDVAQILDRSGVEVRSGHHCTMPLHAHFGWPATTRASFGVYNTEKEIDLMVSALQNIQKVFRHG